MLDMVLECTHITLVLTALSSCLCFQAVGVLELGSQHLQLHRDYPVHPALGVLAVPLRCHIHGTPILPIACMSVCRGTLCMCMSVCSCDTGVAASAGLRFGYLSTVVHMWLALAGL